MVKSYLNQLSDKLLRAIDLIDTKNYDQAIMILMLNRELIGAFIEDIEELETKARFIQKINEIIEEPL